MAGIYGTVNALGDVEGMKQILLDTPYVVGSRIYCDGFSSHGQVSLKTFHVASVEEDGIFVQVNGFAYNSEDFERQVLNHYRDGTLSEYFQTVDGYFHGSIVDSHRKSISIFSDRFGLRFVYYYYDGTGFAYACEGLFGRRGED